MRLSLPRVNIDILVNVFGYPALWPPQRVPADGSERAFVSRGYLKMRACQDFESYNRHIPIRDSLA